MKITFKFDKKNILTLILIGIISLFIVIGITYYLLTPKKEKVDVKYEKNIVQVSNEKIITVKSTAPITDDSKETKSQKISFIVSNLNMPMSACYKLEMDIKDISKEIKNSYLNFELRNEKFDTSVFGNFSNIKNNKIILETNQSINFEEYINYSLKIWLRKNSDIDQSNMIDKDLKFYIKVYAYKGDCK